MKIWRQAIEAGAQRPIHLWPHERLSDDLSASVP